MGADFPIAGWQSSFAALIAAGLVVGSFLGARYAMSVSNETLEKVFGVTLVLIGLKMIIGK